MLIRLSHTALDLVPLAFSEIAVPAIAFRVAPLVADRGCDGETTIRFLFEGVGRRYNVLPASCRARGVRVACIWLEEKHTWAVPAVAENGAAVVPRLFQQADDRPIVAGAKLLFGLGRNRNAASFHDLPLVALSVCVRQPDKHVKLKAVRRAVILVGPNE